MWWLGLGCGCQVGRAGPALYMWGAPRLVVPCALCSTDPGGRCGALEGSPPGARSAGLVPHLHAHGGALCSPLVPTRCGGWQHSRVDGGVRSPALGPLHGGPTAEAVCETPLWVQEACCRCRGSGMASPRHTGHTRVPCACGGHPCLGHLQRLLPREPAVEEGAVLGRRRVSQRTWGQGEQCRPHDSCWCGADLVHVPGSAVLGPGTGGPPARGSPLHGHPAGTGTGQSSGGRACCACVACTRGPGVLRRRPLPFGPKPPLPHDPDTPRPGLNRARRRIQGALYQSSVGCSRKWPARRGTWSPRIPLLACHGQTTLNIPDPVRSRKSSRVGPD